jgi:hypothetical protein
MNQFPCLSIHCRIIFHCAPLVWSTSVKKTTFKNGDEGIFDQCPGPKFIFWYILLTGYMTDLNLRVVKHLFDIKYKICKGV